MRHLNAHATPMRFLQETILTAHVHNNDASLSVSKDDVVLQFAVERHSDAERIGNKAFVSSSPRHAHPHTPLGGTEMVDDFWEDYDAFSDNVLAANYKLISNALQRWLGLIDGNPLTAQELVPLETSMDFEKWYADCEATQGSMVGSASLTFPMERAKRLGANLFLVRKAAADEFGAVEIGHTFLSGDSHYDANVREFQYQIFQPLRQELRTYLSRRIRDAQLGGPERASAPASDRVVQLDHNSKVYLDAIESLNHIRNTVAQSNEYDDEADKGQRLAELDASRTLLGAMQVRIDALRAVMTPCLKYLGEKFVEGTIGVAITTGIVALAALLGIHLFM